MYVDSIADTSRVPHAVRLRDHIFGSNPTCAPNAGLDVLVFQGGEVFGARGASEDASSLSDCQGGHR